MASRAGTISGPSESISVTTGLFRALPPSPYKTTAAAPSTMSLVTHHATATPTSAAAIA
jgi:hypothetical protein